MSYFSKLLAVLKGAQSFPQPLRRNALIVFLFAFAISPHFLAAQTGGRIVVLSKMRRAQLFRTARSCLSIQRPA
jgi:hypothetical protein